MGIQLHQNNPYHIFNKKYNMYHNGLSQLDSPCHTLIGMVWFGLKLLLIYAIIVISFKS